MPIRVHSATASKTVRFHEVHEKDGARIEHRRICPRDDQEVPYEHILKGFEVAHDEYVVLNDDEIKAAAGPKSKRIDVEHFVPAEEIDPVFFERTYYLGAGKDAGDAYRLLHAALERAGRVAIARWVFHDRERLVAIRCRERILSMHTLRFQDELIRRKDLDLPRTGRKPSRREINMASTLLDSLESRFRPGRYRDTHREAVLEVIKRKAAGREIELPEREDADEASDLEAALQASVEDTDGRRRTRSRRRRSKAKSRS